ncbi:unnamed protein product [Acanthoscelides obtectus]|uniref:Uncharacterized protein n=1 Tax=Acanthoscelides obtectus TaxID=200917 RepID=A0A9P0LC95_ACAOB|nr:unnamed protein product [Acanthoscelides obtectus]CAK1621816.1 hypothetical protein AOBTE_LOCUS1144 [Acanthoscelides obtectus]
MDNRRQISTLVNLPATCKSLLRSSLKRLPANCKSRGVGNAVSSILPGEDDLGVGSSPI